MWSPPGKGADPLGVQMLNVKIDLSAYDKDKAALFLFALTHCFNIKPIQQLFNEALLSGPVSIKIVPREQAPFGAMLETNRIIMLADNSPIFQTINDLLFELCNLINPGFKDTVCSRFNSADAFATAIEKVEYDSVKHHRQLMRLVVNDPYYKTMLKAEYHNVTEEILDKIRAVILNDYINDESFEEALQRLKTKQSGHLLSHYDTYKNYYQDWSSQHRPSRRKLPELPHKRSGRKLPELPRGAKT